MVHVLRYGRAFCGEPGTPSEWPAGHQWVGIESIGSATCPTCIANAKAYVKEANAKPNAASALRRSPAVQRRK